MSESTVTVFLTGPISPTPTPADFFVCTCGHPIKSHGDRAVAACVPEEIHHFASIGGDGGLMPVSQRCYCAGWRRA